MRVLIVEDDVKLAGLIQRALREQGTLADAAHDGEDALWMADATPYDVMVLDINLPGINGFETCQQLRASRVRAPILMLTARAAVDDRVTGLDTGADDYLVKPFDISEMFARIRALARRGPVARGPVLSIGDLSLDAATRAVSRGSTQIALSTKEFQLLEVFMRRPGQVLSRYDLLEGAWDMAYENRSNVVDVYVRYLRNKIDRPFGTRTIETVRGAGYRLSAPARQPLRPQRSHETAGQLRCERRGSARGQWSPRLRRVPPGVASHRSVAGSRTGLMSMTGVLSSASSGPARIRSPWTAAMRTRCSPMGLGRSGERVLNTPAGGRAGSSRGRVTSTPRSARSSQVTTMISAPAARSRRPSATSGSKTSQALGAPSSPCRGARARLVRGDSTHPMGTT
jgi:two-component system OmpR family response regulator